jgi:hypothetical protein
MFTEMVGLRRQLVLRLRRLQANKPQAVTKARLYKQSVISDSLWQSFLTRLKSRLVPLLRAGAIDLVELDRLYRERQPVAGMDSDVIADSLRSTVEDSAFLQEFEANLEVSVENMRRTVSGAVLDWYHTPGATLADVTAQLEPIFGAYNAERIAVTEMTALNARVQRAEAEQIGATTWVFQSMRDEVVCVHYVVGPDGAGYDGCRALHGKAFDINDALMPAATHKACRCYPVFQPPHLERI